MQGGTGCGRLDEVVGVSTVLLTVAEALPLLDADVEEGWKNIPKCCKPLVCVRGFGIFCFTASNGALHFLLLLWLLGLRSSYGLSANAVLFSVLDPMYNPTLGTKSSYVYNASVHHFSQLHVNDEKH